MNRYTIFLFLSLFIPLLSFGQKFDVNNYKPIQSSGELPLDFRVKSEQKYIEDKAELSKKEKRFTRKSQEKFLLQSNFMLDNLLQSGRILYNDPLSKYVNKVTDELLKDEDNQSLRNEIQVYVTKSPYVNAFSTDQGIIVINIGLLAQLENEAQLAFIIAHEIIHYTKKHSINEFVQTAKISKGRDGYRRLSHNDLYLNKNLRSRENEAEADELAFTNFYSKSNYCLEELDGAFDVLQYSYLPFDEIVFDKEFFNTKYFKLPAEYFLDSINEIKVDDNYDETKSTHPSIDERRARINSLIKAKDNSGRKKFILPNDDFENARAQARFEVIRQLLINRSYPEVIYNSYVLLKKYPNNKFLKTAIASSLYGLLKYKLSGEYGDVCESYRKIEGESQQVFHLFKKIEKEELNILALNYCWSLHQEYPQNDYIRNICDDLFKELVFKLKFKLKDFNDKASLVSNVNNKEEEKDSLKLSKYDRIKGKIKKQESIYTNVFVDFMKDKEFVERFEHWENKYYEGDEVLESKMTEVEKEKFNRDKKKKEKQIAKYGYALGIDTVVVVDPAFYKINVRIKTKLRLIKSERKQQELNQIITKCADLAELDISMLDSKNLNSGETDAFNDHALINDWLNERINHDTMDFVLSESQYTEDLIEKYNTKYFSWCVFVHVKERYDKDQKKTACLMMGLFTLPLFVLYMAEPVYSTYYYNYLYDIETGKVVFSTSERIKQNDNTDLVKSKVYYTFLQFKARRKK